MIRPRRLAPLEGLFRQFANPGGRGEIVRNWRAARLRRRYPTQSDTIRTRTDCSRGYTIPMLISEMDGQGVYQFLELGSAFLLSAAIGLEREIRHKSAGLRTYTVVGTAAALFMLISKYGFMNVLANGLVVLDPSRVAAQIVTGIGFIGAGLIFVREDRVQGLTTAATVWLVTAIGMACAAGLLRLALAVTIAYFIVAFVFPPYCVYFQARRCPPNRSRVRTLTRY